MIFRAHVWEDDTCIASANYYVIAWYIGMNPYRIGILDIDMWIRE